MKDLVKNIQLILLAVILICTVLAVLLEIRNMFINQTVTLADLLLMFLYLEVLAMVRVFWDEQSISITLPLLIAITALSRFIILQGKRDGRFTTIIRVFSNCIYSYCNSCIKTKTQR